MRRLFAHAQTQPDREYHDGRAGCGDRPASHPSARLRMHRFGGGSAHRLVERWRRFLARQAAIERLQLFFAGQCVIVLVVVRIHSANCSRNRFMA